MKRVAVVTVGKRAGGAAVVELRVTYDRPAAVSQAEANGKFLDFLDNLSMLVAEHAVVRLRQVKITRKNGRPV